MKDIIDALNWRYATKKFDSNKKIEKSLFDKLMDSLILSPSSYGLQPWKFIVVNNTEVRLKLLEAGYNQPQILEASHIVVLANKKDIDTKLVDEYIEFVSKERDIDISKLQGLGEMMKNNFSGKTNEELRNWATHQLYLSAGVLLTSCAFYGVDSCPMEGFDSSKVDEILGLSSLGLESKIMITLGYRSDEDKSVLYKKVRFNKKDVFIEIN